MKWQPTQPQNYAAWITTPGRAIDQAVIARALSRQDDLLKPRGSLGQLERLACRLAGLQGRDVPAITAPLILVFAADHGLAATPGLSAYPQAVTVAMLRAYAAGQAAICVLARELGAKLEVWDVGTIGTDRIAGVQVSKTRHGTASILIGPAMSSADLAAALEAGASAVRLAVSSGADLLILGEMGIGNTGIAAGIAAVLTGKAVAALIGPGAGLAQSSLPGKCALIEQALAANGLHERPTADVLVVLERIGGLEIAALMGAMIAAAQSGVAVLVDGFICSVAALAACRLNPSIMPWLIFAHRSAEPGHRFVLEALGATPLLDLGLRLGEASGAALAMPLLRLACALHNSMATFAQAGVDPGP